MPPADPSQVPYDSDAFLAAIIASSNDAIISKDAKGIITSWNPAAERLFGFASAEAVGQPVTLIFPPDRLPEEEMILGRVLRGEHLGHYRTVRRHKSGELIDVSLSVSPIRDRTGRIIGASKIVHDLREQTREQERFRVTLSSIGDGVISTDVEGAVTFINPVAERLTGWPAPQAVGRPLAEVFQIVNETSREAVESPVIKVLRDGTVVGLANHTVLVSRDGSERPIDDSAAPIRSRDGRLLGVVLVFRDVAERRAAELVSLRLAAIVEGSEDAIVGKNLQGIVTNWNPGAQRIFGYTADEMIGSSITKIIPPDRLNEEQRILARLQAGERVEHFETIRVRKDGRPIHVSLTISPIRDGKGHIIGASKIARDITAQKQAELALRDAQTTLQSHALDLEQKVRERTAKLQDMIGELEAFSYSLSHDLRAPLRAIQGFTELVLTDYGDRIPEATDHLRRVVNAAARMDRLIQDVLAFARVSRQDIVVKPLDVDQLVRDLIEERPELHPPRAVVEVRHPLLPVVGHDASLTQCLTNLLDNAVKFVAPGVTPNVKVFTEARDGQVRINVGDNGIGIDPDGQRRLFTAFQRLATPQPYHGTGVGLAIVRKAAERMNGTVGVESQPGRGSTFWVELPQA
ncbi:MAG TPA: PAS domain S-box protein [Opitutaceae bacterium]|nr:PAS domain S-box protein [Opitutaceae bacterium]